MLTLPSLVCRSNAIIALFAALSGPVWPLDEPQREATPDSSRERVESPAERLAARRALAVAGRAPRFPRWRRGEVLSVDGTPMTDLARPFDSWTVSARRTPELFPPTIAEPERWAEVQEQLLPVGGCPCTGGSGLPGEVPSPSLRAGKNATPGQVVLTWSPSCSVDASDYSVHEGTLKVWYTHSPRACSTAGVSSWTLTPASGNRYFLVVPLTDDDEGSYGRRSDGEERAQSVPSCRSAIVAHACP
jgi:hypothetical protein